MIPSNVSRVARILAEKSNCRFRLGAVVYDGKRILGGGFNENKTHPKSPSPYKIVHAEFSAALSSRQTSFRNVSLYVHRLKKNGGQGLAKPCEHCTIMLKQLGLKEVFYSNDGGGIDRM